MTDTKKYFITGGGTGGHIYPALAVIRELIKNGADKQKDIFYLGNKDNLEFQIASDEGLNFLSYKVCGMPRGLSFKIFLFVYELFVSTIKALFYALKHKPDVVFATGGYVCAPILIAARVLKIPYVLHDCDAHPGIVSKVFSKGACAMSLAFEGAKSSVKCANAYVCGNPIREEFKTLSKNDARNSLGIKRDFIILIMGGSLGAKTINTAALDIVDQYKDSPEIQIIWQSGKKNFDDVKKVVEEKFGSIPANLILRPYFENMTIPLIASDVAISRAGSLSLSELCAASLPSILIPYPYAAADHQRANAKKMCEYGASLYLDDKDCTGEKLKQILEEFMNNKDALQKAAQCANANAKYSALKDIVELINLAASNEKC